MSDVMEQFETLSPQKQALFESLLRERRANRAAPQPAAPAPIATASDQRYLPFPLTDMQQAYWVGRNSGFEMGNVATHMYEEFENEALDLERLNHAWQQLIARHDMLRAIVLPDGRQQILREVPPYRIAVTDLRGQAPEYVAAYLAQVRQQMSHQVLPSDRWPLFDLRASRLDDQHMRVHISIDGLLLDGWSYQLLFQEWSQVYTDPDTPLPPLQLSFRDYVVAEIAMRDSLEYQHALAYWQQRLPDLPPAPQLTLAMNPGMLREPHFVRRAARLEPQLWQQIKAQAATRGLTPSSLLLAVYADILAVWSRTPRFTINVPRFNRLPLHPQVNDILGEFASFTPLMVDNTGRDTLAARAQRLQEQLWRDLDHHHVSGVQILRELSQLQGRAASAALPIVFTSLPSDVDGRNTSHILLPSDHSVYGITQTSQVWLDHQGIEEGGALLFNWDAVEDLFPAGMLDDMFDAFTRLLRQLADEQAWEEVWPNTVRRCVPAAQQEQWATINATDAPIPNELLQTLVLAQARQRPAQPAISTAARTLTYQELARRAAQAGHWLRRKGAQPNTLVGVVMEKGWEQVVGVLGILQAGAAYLPIDPDLPDERRRYLLEHGQVTLIVTQSWVDEQLEWPPHIQRLQIDAQSLPTDDLPPLEPTQRLDDLAYVIYTSGSTGQPKGVKIAQRGLVNAIAYTNQRFEVGPQDRVLALTALHHDMSAYDIFGILAAGGTIVMPNAVAARDPAHWSELMLREQVTIWNSVPQMLEMLLEHAAGRAELLPQSLRMAFLGGDWISTTLPDRLHALVPSAQLVSVGGPTETTLWNICYPVVQGSPDGQSIPYGRPIANTRYYIMNEALGMCPVWVAGQMYCGGVGLAHGYWRDEEKTRASFITHPRTGERLYRTGDLGRYRPDGMIEFLGREDFQVKVQGHRIELGEIESVLAQHPEVRTSVVTIVDAESGSKRLVAYIVPSAGSAAQLGELGDFLEESYTEDQPAGLLVDPTERIAFKLRQHGLRQNTDGYTHVQLPRPNMDEALSAAYARRRSYRMFAGESIALERLNGLLSSMLQVDLAGSPLPKYRYPSPGGLYPVQLYLYVKPGRVDGLEAGVYYYHPHLHQLVLVAPGLQLDRSIHVAANLPLFDASSFTLFLIGHTRAIEPMYGAHSTHFMALEAGYMSQLLMEASPEHAIGLCPVGSLNFAAIRHLFALDEQDVLLHTLLGGGIAPDQMTTEAFLQEALQVSSTKGTNDPADRQNGALVGKIRQFAREKLPRHMIPSAFIVLEKLPLTANGKVDRKALAAPDTLKFEQETEYIAPQSELEQTIAAAWREVLRIDHVGIHDNFFELGSNSLHLVQVHSLLLQVLDREIAITDLFQHPTIATLAEALSAEQNDTDLLQTMQDRAQTRSEARLRQRQRHR
jgi:amino acid adenylation domain-containing protein